MLYLEDYLEMIETLPQDLRDRFTEMREMDLQVQNAMDTLEERVKTLFANAKKMKPEARDEQFEKIRQDYYKALEDADEKVQLANQIYDLVDRHLRKLDQELQKFKMELEADNAGITEILERRSLELDNPTPSGSSQHGGKPKTEKRKYVTQTEHQPEKRPASEKLLRTLTNGTPDSPVSYRSNTSTPPTPSLYPSLQQPSPALTLPNLGQIGAGSGAIAAAAAQAVNQTLQMQQGRRTSSLKTTYEVMKNANLTNLGLDFNLGTNYGVTAQASSPSISTADTSRSQRTQKKTPKAAAAAAAAASTAVPAPAPVETFQPQSTIIEEPATSSIDWTFDPNEPRYCICNQVSYGDMVGCDNEDCPIEWFHYGCVGISEPPKGKWYCPQCTAAMKRRGVKQK